MRTLLPFTHKLLLLCAPDDPPGGPNPPADQSPPDDAGEKKSYTQKELDALFAERGKQGARSKEQEILSALGVSNLDDVKAKLQRAQQAEDAQKSELQKAQELATREKERADKAEADRQAAEARALETALKAALSAEALKQGIDEGELKSVWLEFRDDQDLRGKVEADDEFNFTGLEKAVEAIVKAHPRWLKAEGDGRRKQPDINATRRGPQTEPTQEELVRRKRASATYSGI